MEFFIKEIIEIDEVRNIIIHDPENMSEKAKEIAEEFIKTGVKPKLPQGMLPVFVLGSMCENALKKYDARGVDREISLKTLRDINVWLNNYKNRYNEWGVWKFSWLAYAFRGDLFHLGRLQFRIEKILHGVPSGEYGIETHIQQGKPLKVEDCLASFDMAREFFKKHFPEYHPDYFMCDSWLLNPNLEKIAPESNIAKFMKLWEKIEFPDDGGAQAVERIFGFDVKPCDVADFEPVTTLQKNAKEFLLSGGDLRMTAGYIKV
ncbi:MAG: DUF5596 domain-containing protein [Clostridia bacterium]|nr:DUF5596 domain-containing protein [Clostridia bacterium]